MALRTVAAPSVVRFRPRAATTDVARDATISVRFTKSMDRASTKAAFSVTADGKRVPGKVTLRRGRHRPRLRPVIEPAVRASVVTTVAATAMSRTTSRSASPTKAHVHGRPRSRPPATTGSRRPGRRRTVAVAVAAPSAAAAGAPVERYYLRLMNCTRTGGWVTSGGDCSSPGGRSVAPLRLDAGISTQGLAPVRQEARRQQHVHPFQRRQPRRSSSPRGYSSYRWAENLGCRSGNPFSAVLGQPSLLPERAAWSPTAATT